MALTDVLLNTIQSNRHVSTVKRWGIPATLRLSSCKTAPLTSARLLLSSLQGCISCSSSHCIINTPSVLCKLYIYITLILFMQSFLSSNDEWMIKILSYWFIYVICDQHILKSYLAKCVRQIVGSSFMESSLAKDARYYNIDIWQLFFVCNNAWDSTAISSWLHLMLQLMSFDITLITLCLALHIPFDLLSS